MVLREANFMLRICLVAAIMLAVYQALGSVTFAASNIPLTKVSHLIDISHGFNQPSDVAVAVDGRIYVVDGVNNVIKAFRKNGTYDFSFGKYGKGEGEFNSPLGMDVGLSGTVYVADSGNNRLQLFNSKGEFLRQATMPSMDGKPADPTDVAVDEARNRCYVVDNDNHRVAIFELKSLKLLKTFGVPGAEKREFRYPFLIDVDKTGFLYIVDVVNTRVQVFNPDGLFVTIIGGWGVEKGNFFRPKGVAIDQEGFVYVSDSYMGVIQIFRPNGWFHSVVADNNGDKVRKFKTPIGLCIDKDNRLYVVEMLENRVRVYQIKQ